MAALTAMMAQITITNTSLIGPSVSVLAIPTCFPLAMPHHSVLVSVMVFGMEEATAKAVTGTAITAHRMK